MLKEVEWIVEVFNTIQYNTIQYIILYYIILYYMVFQVQKLHYLSGRIINFPGLGYYKICSSFLIKTTKKDKNERNFRK